ncbi:hypothetical protein TNCV_1986371 [Trichonephila clavipes]|nr:hypothetical protein TNCV_1986371 [Trichonephila clavipes]
MFYGFNVRETGIAQVFLILGKRERNQVTYLASREDVLLGLFRVCRNFAAQDWRCALELRHDEASSERTARNTGRVL